MCLVLFLLKQLFSDQTNNTTMSDYDTMYHYMYYIIYESVLPG